MTPEAPMAAAGETGAAPIQEGAAAAAEIAAEEGTQ